MADAEYNALLRMSAESVETFGATEALRWEMRRRCWPWLFALIDGLYYTGLIFYVRRV